MPVKRLRLMALAAAVLVTPALAQMAPVRIQRPVNVQPVVQAPSDAQASVDLMTPEQARARIAELNREKRELNARLTEALATIDSYSKKGGSLVHAYCESETMSRTTAGATEDCAASGYRCAPVEGTCRKSCNVTTDCAGYHVCDTAAHVCVKV